MLDQPDLSNVRQLRMDELLLDNTAAANVEGKVNYNKIPVQQSTFKAGLAQHVHRWFRLTPSFGPELVREMLSVLEYDSGDIVLDPFAGAGTTLIECQFEGLRSYGFEINPFLCFVGNTSLNWSLDVSVLRHHLEDISTQFRLVEPNVHIDNLAEHGLAIPAIHDPLRWWRSDILAQLLVLKRCIDTLEADNATRQFFRLALAGVLVPDLTNVTLGRLQLHFIDKSQADIRVLQSFVAHTENMLSDLHELNELGMPATSQVIHTDSTCLGDLMFAAEVTCVVTSPPYPNRYSYVWNTRPHLYFFDHFDTPKEASELDKATVGGTWGSATSVLMKGEVMAEYPIVQEVVGHVVAQIRQKDNLMANYAMKYFNLLARQIVEMDRLLAKDARVAYVVGCSWLKEVYVETDVLLGKMFEGIGLGYSVARIDRIRSRHSGKDLHESIVYAWKR